MSVNKTIHVGRLTANPETRHLENGRSVTNFSLATSEKYKDRNGERKEKTEFHHVVLWSPLAEIAEKYLSKGKQVYIEGKLTTRSWEDKDGNKRYTTEIVGREMTLLGGNQNASEGASNSAVESPTVDTEIDDLPF